MDRIHEAIRIELDEAINDIFIKHQQELEITDGFVDPVQYEDLDISTADVARLMTSILMYQKYREYER